MPPPPDLIQTALNWAQAHVSWVTSQHVLLEALSAACLAPPSCAQATNTAAAPTAGDGGRDPAGLATITPSTIEAPEKVHAVHFAPGQRKGLAAAILISQVHAIRGPRRPATNHVCVNVLVFMLAVLVPASGAAVDAAESEAASRLISDLGLHIADRPVRERSQWRPPHKILLSPALFVHFHEDLAKLQAIAPDVKFIKLSAMTSSNDIADADAAVGLCAPKMLQAARRLQWIQWLGAGVEECVQQSLIRERQPLITNMQRTGGASMAEHVMGMMLVLSRHLNYFIAQQPRGHWDPDSDHYPQAVDLKGKTLLLVGLGGIGLEVAKRAYAFGMRVTATRVSSAAKPDYVSYVGMPDELVKLARDADFIVNCAPLTRQTTGLFEKEFFNTMKPTAYFINVGRGGSVVTTDLIAVLKSRRIAGAGLDVTDPEPLPSSSSLWRMPNVLITPHVSSNSPMTDQLRLAVLHENLRRYIAGDRMLSVVDIERGY